MENDGNTATNLSPVTESEMRAWFERLASNFVAMSKTAEELESLKQVVNDLQGRLEGQITETRKAKQDISELYGMIQQLERERDVLKSQVAGRDNTIAQLNDALHGREDTISQLKTDIKGLNDTLWQKGQEIAEKDGSLRDAEDSVRYWKARAEQYESSYRSVSDDVNTITKSYHSLEAERNTLRETTSKMKGLLDALNLALNPQLTLVQSEPKQEDSPVNEQPKYEAQNF